MIFENPIGTRGFAFVEYTSDDPQALQTLFERMGFTAVADHGVSPVTRYVQGDINFILNRSTDGQAAAFRKVHGAGANAMGFRVDNAAEAFEKAVARGAAPAKSVSGSMAQDTPAIEGIGGLVIYFVDERTERTLWDEAYRGNGADPAANDKGLVYIDHLTHNLQRGNMDKWASYYERIFNFREIRYFDIEGKVTGLFSKAMTSPDGNIRIPLNESQDDKSQIEEFIRRYNGEGIQHIALGVRDIYSTVPAMRANGVAFQDTPETYYEGIDARVKDHGEDLGALRKDRILIDGAPTEGQGLLLQIFTQDNIGLGPLFFEIIQRKGNEGFGEGNFKALFESIELDQMRRGVI